MDNILDALYNGDIVPCEAPLSPEAKERTHILAERAQALWATLGAGQRVALECYQDAMCDCAMTENRMAFAEGFRLGARLMLTVLEEGE